MKKISFFFLFVSFAINLSAQEDIQEKITSAPQPTKVPVANEDVKIEKSINKSTTISIRAGESQVTHDEAYFLNEIAKIDNQISAINQKIAIINNDPVEAANANASGWFDDMERIKSELETKKANIQNQLD
ncbi:MAG: hypothetical protein NWR50_01780 [Crocinitomicaceae bacterium]|jgi:hypothetical protein|nr:hypothetical protein [Crocinitomicaceae bacterium]